MKAAAVSDLTPFGDELTALLSERGLSQSAIERTTGVSHGHLSMVMRGQRGLGPTDELVERLAVALEVEPDTFADYRRRRALEEYPDAIDKLYRRKKAS